MTIDDAAAIAGQAIAQGLDRPGQRIDLHMRHRAECAACKGERCKGLGACTCEPRIWLLGPDDASYEYDHQAGRWEPTGEPYPGPAVDVTAVAP